MRIVVYSAYYGAREPLNPGCLGEGVGYDRVIFTDHEGISVPGVEVRRDPLTGLDPARASRRAKLRPHRYFPYHDWTLYIDNNAMLTCNPRDLIAELGPEGEAAGFLAFPHPWRDCAYAEAEECRITGRDESRLIVRQVGVYRAHGYPKRHGLSSGMFLLRRGGREDWAMHGERWFEHVLRFARRDQISCDFVAWSLGLSVGRLPGSPTDNRFMYWPAFEARERNDDRLRDLALLPRRVLLASMRRLGERR